MVRYLQIRPLRKWPRADGGVEHKHLGFRRFVEPKSARGPVGGSRVMVAATTTATCGGSLAPVRRRPARAICRPARRGIERERGGR